MKDQFASLDEDILTGMDVASLSESEERFRLSFDLANIGMSLTLPNGRLYRVNQAFCDLLGYTREELQARRFSDITHLDDQAASNECVRCLLAGEKSRFRLEKRYVRKDGEIVWTDFSTIVVRDAAGEPICFVTHVLDITERRQSQERDRLIRDVLETLNRQEAGSHTIRDILLLVKKSTGLEAVGLRLKEDDDFPYFETNGFPDHFVRVERYLCARDAAGNMVRDVQGNAVLECMCGNILRGRTDSKQPFFTDGGSFWTNSTSDLPASTRDENLQSRTCNRCNSEGYESVALVPLRVNDEIIGLLQLNDRRRHRFTPEMIRFFEGLGASIGIALARKQAEKERTALEAQLVQSQKMEAIGSLAGGVAHDFNNLLSVIMSYTSLALKDMRDGDPLRDGLLEVKKAGERAAALIRQLLAFSRKQVLRPETLDLNHVMAGIEPMLRRILGEDIELLDLLAPDIGLTLADPGQIEQVIMNLVVNARDAMPEGGKLVIETANMLIDEASSVQHLALSPGFYVRLAVTDTGCGMDEHTRARLFEPFFTTKGEGKGTGLGLSTVYGIVKQSGGDIRVDSRPGAGTTFNIYFPRALPATAPCRRIPAAISRVAGTETILVVEDDEAVRNIVRRILAGTGYTVLTAANGGEALLTCEQHQGEIHLVLTDVVMPLMSGREFAARLAKSRLKTKILYMSGYTDDAIVHHGVRDPGTHFISKPFTLTDLAQKIREVLDEGGTGPADGNEHVIETDSPN